jgi:6-pyruvoyltetrahydropterin/6-carboxytetrahydropterin synthase
MTRHRIFVGKDVHKFSSAHMSVFPGGDKERLHGHNFQVRLAVELHHTRLEGMLDFAVLKDALAAQCKAWDQRLLLAERCPAFRLTRRDEREVEFVLCGKRYVVPADEVLLLPLENVVVETLAEGFATALVERLGGTLRRDVVASLEVSVTESDGQGGTYSWSWDA